MAVSFPLQAVADEIRGSDFGRVEFGATAKFLSLNAASVISFHVSLVGTRNRQ